MADYETSPAKRSDWQLKFRAVLAEADPQRLSQLVSEAEAALFLRYRLLDTIPDGYEEQNALRDAIRKLRVIQTGKLQYPYWNGE